MATVVKLQEFGNEIAVLFDDGSRRLAYPTSGGLWLVSGAPLGPPDGEPDPDPNPSNVFMWPFDPLTTITSRYRTPQRPTHDGLDFAYDGIGGDPIPCIGPGTVVSVSNGSGTGFGNFVGVDHGTVNGANLRSLYAHMQTFPPVTVGQVVEKGTTLGPVGNTGNSFGDHLHLEIRVNNTLVNPEIWLEQNVLPD